MKNILFVLSLLLYSFSLNAQTIFINEIHYDNDGADVSEGWEISGPAGTNLNCYSIVLYNGSTGESYGTTVLSGTIADEQCGFGSISFSPSGSIQNGNPDGIVLYNTCTSTVIQFLSYGGDFTATNGVANGITSTNIGVTEPGSTPIGHTLQLIGNGTTYGDFSWQSPSSGSLGSVNSGQSFCPCTGIVSEPTNEPTSLTGSPIDCVSGDITWTLGADATNTLIVMSTSPITGTPTDGVDYTANSVFGSGDILLAGEFVVYNGNGGTVNITGLTENTTYYITTFSYNGALPDCEENYLTGGTTTSFTTATTASGCIPCPGLGTEPVNNPTALAATDSECISSTVSWTLGADATNTLIVISTSAITGNPTDGVNYTANSEFGSGDILNAGEFIVYNGTGNSVTVSGLIDNTTYFVTAFSYNGTTVDCEENYLVSGSSINFTTNSGCAPSSTGCVDGSMHISGAGCGCLGGCDLTPAGGVDCGSGSSGDCNQPTLIADVIVPDGCTFTVLAEIKVRQNGCTSSGADGGDDLVVDILGGSKIPVSGPSNSDLSDSYTLVGPGTIRITANTNREDELVTYSTSFTGDFCVACASILPIDLIEFGANELEEYTNVFWTTASERNNDYFVIEKSTNGINFESIGEVNGANNSNILKEYSFNDYNLTLGTVYYRLKQVDFDGEYSYSHIIKLNSNYSTVFYHKEKIHIDYKANPKTKQTLNMYGASGRLIHSQQITNSETIDWNHKGFFIIEIPEIQLRQKIICE